MSLDLGLINCRNTRTPLGEGTVWHWQWSWLCNTAEHVQAECGLLGRFLHSECVSEDQGRFQQTHLQYPWGLLWCGGPVQRRLQLVIHVSSYCRIRHHHSYGHLIVATPSLSCNAAAYLHSDTGDRIWFVTLLRCYCILWLTTPPGPCLLLTLPIIKS